MAHAERAMGAYRGIEGGEVVVDTVAREVIKSATRASWLEQLTAASLPMRVGEAPAGSPWAHSVEPTTGDPQLLSVHADGEPESWWVDRRNMRISQAAADSPLGEATVIDAADLADRAQLVLGRPVTLRWFLDGGRVWLSDVEPLSPRVAFTNATYRRTAPLMASPGTLSPLSVDMLDQALRREQPADGEPFVRRLFGQAYRRLSENVGDRSLSERDRLARGLWRASRVLSDLALPTADVARFRRAVAHETPRFETEKLPALHTEDLIDSLHARVALVVQALSLLERSRQATLSLLPVLNLTAGTVGREQLAALAEPLPTAQRRAVHDRLVALGHLLVREHGELTRAPDEHDSKALRQAWQRARRTLARVRVLGMDVRPGACGESDEELLRAVREARSLLDFAPDQRRREAERELLECAADSKLVAANVTVLHTALALLRRLSRAKGVIVDGLALSLLRVREAAQEAGDRLSQEGVIDESEDVFYLELEELVQALRGELGAYAARSRLRREDDLRWRNFEPPRRLGGRRFSAPA